MIELRVTDHGQPRRIVFTGDLGQWDKPIVRNPAVFTEADYVVMESTYGDRDHENHGSVESQLEKVVLETVAEGGKLIMPIFAIERAQELIYYLNRLLAARRIPAGAGVSRQSDGGRRERGLPPPPRVFRRRGRARSSPPGGSLLKFPSLRVVRDAEESMAINAFKGPAIIMSTSGMCTAGRIKHHLAQHIGDPACTILFVGYQSQGTLGRQILDGNREVRIHGISRLVRRAGAHRFRAFPATPTATGLLKWLSHFRAAAPPSLHHPRRTAGVAWRWPSRSASRWAGT